MSDQPPAAVEKKTRFFQLSREEKGRLVAVRDPRPYRFFARKNGLAFSFGGGRRRRAQERSSLVLRPPPQRREGERKVGSFEHAKKRENRLIPCNGLG